MDLFVVVAAALVASCLTMFSGFGLGTLLLPVFALFFPVDLAVAATAAVHGANSVLKMALLGRLADRGMVLRFGLPAIVAAAAGAAVLGMLAGQAPVLQYDVRGVHASVSPLKVVMGLLMLGFAVLELHPRFASLSFGRSYLPVGGLLSGFFGGLSGHQGALRSAFLSKAGLAPDRLVGTNAAIGFLVDLSRLSTYAALAAGGGAFAVSGPAHVRLVVAGILAAFAGVLVGKRLLPSVTIRVVQRVTGGLLALIGLLLVAGLL